MFLGAHLGVGVGFWVMCAVNWSVSFVLVCIICIALAISMTCIVVPSVFPFLLRWRYDFHIFSYDC